MLTKQEADKLMEMEGKARGVEAKEDFEFVLQEKGEKGLKKVENRMAELGFPLKYKELKVMLWHPIGLGVLLRFVIKEVFNFNEEDIYKWGRANVTSSIFAKIFMKYFGSLDLIAKQVPVMWRRYHTLGNLEMPEFSKKSKYAILRLKNFKGNPIHCIILNGYFSKISEMVVRFPVKCKETKCVLRGDEYHEYSLTW